MVWSKASTFLDNLRYIKGLSINDYLWDLGGEPKLTKSDGKGGQPI